MSKAYLKAKEKYDAVINDAGRGDWYCRTNRIGAPKHPVGCHEIHHVERTFSRRASSASTASTISTVASVGKVEINPSPPLEQQQQSQAKKEWSKLKQWAYRSAV